MLSIREAIEKIKRQSKNFGVENISIHQAYNRILAEDVFADRDYPPFNRATMDGYAIRASDLNAGLSEFICIATVFAGEVSKQEVTAGTCIKIMTGAPIPAGADAVVRIEDSIEKDSLVHFNISSIRAGQFIASMGEDKKKDQLLIKKNLQIDAVTVAALAVAGKAEVTVYRIPTITIISTGNEIVKTGDDTLPHQIRDSNSIALVNFLKRYEISCNTILIPDDKEKLIKILSKHMNQDILIISGGVSMGEADHVPEVLMSLGASQEFHRVKIKPGNPLWFGAFPDGGVVFGLPGNPVSVQVGYKVFIEPFIRKCFSMEPLKPLYLPLFEDKPKKSKFTEYFPCTLVNKNNTSGLIPKQMNSSGDIAATLYSDGVAIHPENQENLSANTNVEFYSW